MEIYKTKLIIKNEEKCKHHWMIETNTHSTSKGICKLCDQEREFNNSLPQLDYIGSVEEYLEIFNPDIEVNIIESDEDL